MGWRYTIDPAKSPKEMDWIVEIDPGHPIRQLAIYSWTATRSKICPPPRANRGRRGSRANKAISAG